MRNTTKKISEETTDLDKNLTVDGSDIETSSKYNGNSLETPKVSGEPIEIYNNNAETDILKAMFYTARECAANASADCHNFLVDYLATETENGSKYPFTGFFIADSEKEGFGYAVYKLGADIYYRPLKELYQICQDVIDGVPGRSWESLKYSYRKTSEPLDCYPVTDREDCLFIIDSIFSSMCGKSYTSDSIINGIINEKDIKDINESIKIRKHNKLGTDGLAKNSIKFKEAKYGTPEENSFKQEIEDKQKKDGTVGALDPQQDEENASYKPQLPNVNLIEENENPFLAEGAAIEYEVNDKVLYKGESWDVFSITGVYGDKQRLRITKEGQVLDVLSNEVKPDPEQFQDIDNTPDQFEFDKNNLNKTPKNPKAEEMADLNGKTVECNIVVDSTTLTGTLNGDKFKANLQDILEGLDDIRVQLGDQEETWHKDNISIEQENWPYAVIASEDDEPLRKIKVSPMSYVEAKDENDLVDCVVGDKPTQLPKRVIRIIA